MARELVGHGEPFRELRAKPAHLDQRLDVGHVRVVAQEVPGVVGIRTDDRDRAQIGSKRQRPVVGQKHDGLASHFPRQRPILAEGDLGRVRNDIRLLEQPEFELGPQHAPHRQIDGGHLDLAGGDCPRQGAPVELRRR